MLTKASLNFGHFNFNAIKSYIRIKQITEIFSQTYA